MFHRGFLSLTLVQSFCMRFCKENDCLVNLNEINDSFMSHMYRLSHWWILFYLYIYLSN
jgi:hypothetical protein